MFTCAALLRRRADSKSFRAFFIYLLAVGTKACAMYFVYARWGRSYTYSYCELVLNLICIGISFYVLYEVVQNVLTAGTITMNRSNVLLMTASLLIVAALLSFTFEAKQDFLPLKIYMMASNLARFQQLGLLLTLAILTLFFGFYWGDLAFGVAAGFGLYASMELFNTYIRGHFGPVMNHLFNVADVWSYQAASCIWLFYLLRNRPPTKPPSLPKVELSQYEDPLKDLQR
jgi:hypothetical protein